MNMTKKTSEEVGRINRREKHKTGEIRVSTSTVVALFSKMALTGPRIAMVDMVFLAFFNSVSISAVGVDGARACL